VNVQAFRRKMIYIGLMVLLLVPLYVLGQPKTQRGGKEVSPGGTLAQLRDQHNIGQAALGKIDPASESMRLATLGMRGIASTILWQQADYYKREKFWDRYAATLKQIALLQPHFVNVWDHQAHNLTYNISVEFDGYKQRYEWVKKGIDFLVDGTRFNARQPILQWFLGIYTGQKIGVADEKKQYRELFRNDNDYHDRLTSQGIDARQSDVLGSDGKPDHWLVGRQWFLQSYDLVKAGAYCKKSPHIYYSDSPKCRLRYSEAIEEEGVLDDRAKFSWNKAGDEWKEFGDRDILTTWGHTIKMNGLLSARESLKASMEAFNEEVGDAGERLTEKIRSELPSEEKQALDTPEDQRSTAQQKLAYEAGQKLKPSVMQIAEFAGPGKSRSAVDLATRVREANEYVSHVEAYRNQVNYQYWETRAIAEQRDVTVAARRQMFEADALLQEAKLDEAITKYDEAWANWYQVFRRYPVLMTDDIASDVIKSIRRYKRILDSDLPEDFPLAEFVKFKEMYDKGGMDWQVENILSRWTSDASKLDPEADIFETDLIKKDLLIDEGSGVMLPKKELKEGEVPAKDTAPTLEPSDAGQPPEPTPAKELPAESSSDNPSTTRSPNEPPSVRPPTLENPSQEDGLN